MSSADPKAADVCLLLEGTYPYVAGGVSSWVHDIIRGHPELTFSLVHIGPQKGAYSELRYKVPDNVIGLHEIYCQEPTVDRPTSADRAALLHQIESMRRSAETGTHEVLKGIRRIHLNEGEPSDWLNDLLRNDLSVAEFLHGKSAFDMIAELSERVAPSAPFVDFFWHMRSMHVPMLRLLAAKIPFAQSYHAVSTGYAGLLGALASARTGRPYIVTEHGIYARERDIELARADWITDRFARDRQSILQEAAPSPLRRIWSRFFRSLSRMAYAQASKIVTLSDVNCRKQLLDGAPDDKTLVVPNGVDVNALAEISARRRPARHRPMRVGFVGRIVSIKDVITFIKACDLALRNAPLEVRLIGPDQEDPTYAARCHNLITTLGREEEIRFVGPQPMEQIYPDLDLVVLTSFSEGQPLVILEAHAAGLPVIATDVGACRELLEGRTLNDRRLGPSGIVTRVANPPETAAAILTLARDPVLRQRMGETGKRRVHTYYQRRDMLASYRTLYSSLVNS